MINLVFKFLPAVFFLFGKENFFVKHVSMANDGLRKLSIQSQ